MNETFSQISEKLGNLTSEQDRNLFDRTFTLQKHDKNVFVFGYDDKTACDAFLAENRNALFSAVGSVCGQLPELKFKQLPKSYASEKKDEKPKKANYKKGVKNIVASLICLVLALILGVISINFIANRKFKENFYSVSINKTKDNFRIIQLSDLHTSTYGKDNADLIDRITKLEPDIIILTGDCVDQDAAAENTVSLCTALAKIAPTYYIYGNNECQKAFSNAMTLESLDELTGQPGETKDSQKLYDLDNGLKKTLEATGVKVLFNESDLITIGSTDIRIFGTLTSNPSAFWPYAGTAFNSFLNENTDEIKIFACHEPLLLETLEDEKWGDLVLCGDTHGGVVRLPGIGALYTRDDGLFPEKRGAMVYGKYKLGSSQVIVSSGLENKNPLRIFNQPEIVIVDVNNY